LVKFAKEATGNLARGNIDRATKNLADSSVVYGESLILLSQLNPELVRQYFIMRINSLKEYPTQLAVTKIAMKHYSEYLQNRRYETERWKQELLNAYNSVDVK
jgi:hypothetical protein